MVPTISHRGESFLNFLIVALLQLKSLHYYILIKKLLSVTHGGVLGVIFRYVLKIPLTASRNFVLLNCSLNRIQKDEKSWRLVSWGDVAHLQGMAYS